jgi:hypothetical protein
MSDYFMKGDRVKVAVRHPWMPGRHGTVKEVQERVGNRYLVKFDLDELGTWHDDEGDAVLRLGDGDLVLLERAVSRAA